MSLRPESFGALAYHFGTRRLSFLKSPVLLDIVKSLSEHPSGDQACAAVGIPTDERETYEQALGTLAKTGLICERSVP